MNAVRAQVSMEFLITVFLIMLLFIIMGFFIYQKYVTSTYIKLNIAGQQLTNSIADSINEISAVGDGYYQYITLPASIYGESYTVRFYKNEPTIFVYTDVMSWSAPLVTSNIGCGRRGICLTKYNDTNKEIYMHITNRTEVKLVNRCGAVLFGDYYLWREGEDWDGYGGKDFYPTKLEGMDPKYNASENAIMFSNEANVSDYILWNVTLPNYACYTFWIRPFQETFEGRVGYSTTWIENIQMGSEIVGYNESKRCIWFNQDRIILSDMKHTIKMNFSRPYWIGGKANVDIDVLMLTTDPLYDPSSQNLPTGKPPDAWEI